MLLKLGTRGWGDEGVGGGNDDNISPVGPGRIWLEVFGSKKAKAAYGVTIKGSEHTLPLPRT